MDKAIQNQAIVLISLATGIVIGACAYIILMGIYAYTREFQKYPQYTNDIAGIIGAVICGITTGIVFTFLKGGCNGV